MHRLRVLVPTEITNWTRWIVWANLIVNIMIVGTGGLVRLTGSGLGCPTWPLCNESSLVPTPEMGIHGFIEFGNRTLTGVLVVVSLLAFLAVMRTAPSLRLARPAFLVGVLIIVQAIVGGVTVLMHLDPRIVGIHFFISAGIVAVAATLVQRMRRGVPVTANTPPRHMWIAMCITAAITWITEIVGVLTTGAGPHAGDVIAARNGLDTELMHHIHSWPGYALVAALMYLLFVLNNGEYTKLLPQAYLLTGLVAGQVALGVFQARTGLPVWAVALHMVIAVVVIAVLTMLVIDAKRTRQATTAVSEAAPAAVTAE
ncbi:COX15/CtaA family protein [Gulosibacter bifidus]|uniref:Heme A synthase n=1 Tax=Gulosibacter bifidus TaxID=272239 RepID=A0ABW5RFP5_9MICO|nr:COX15/CtaA family protein [Gulosibacter bifidus]